MVTYPTRREIEEALRERKAFDGLTMSAIVDSVGAYHVFSYDVCIYSEEPDGSSRYVYSFYSTTTSKHQTILRRTRVNKNTVMVTEIGRQR